MLYRQQLGSREMSVPVKVQQASCEGQISCWMVLTPNHLYLRWHVFGMLSHIVLKAVPRNYGLPIRGIFIV